MAFQDSSRQVTIDRLERRLLREGAARREAERLLEDKSAELYEANARLHDEAAKVRQLSEAINVSADGLAITNPEGFFIYMNPAHAMIFGYAAPEDCIGQSWATLYEPEMLARFETDIMPDFLRDGVWRGEATGRSRTGEPVLQDLTLTRLKDRGILCTTRDISIRKRQEKERERLQALLTESELQDAIGQTAATITHDFGNLLGTIRGFAYLITKQGLGDPLAHERLERILEATNQADALIRRMHTPATVAQKDQFDLADAVKQFAPLMEAQFTAGQRFTVGTANDALPIENDQTLFGRVMTNLVKNAREAMDATGRVSVLVMQADADTPPPTGFRPAGRLERGAALAGPVARMIVEDDGSGIGPDTLKAIFDPFVSTKSKGGPRGLGLASVEELLVTAPCRVTVLSRIGEGTVFSLDFPLLDQRADKTVPADENAARGALVVDDDPHQVSIISGILENEGWEPHGFHDPAQALAVFSAAPGAFRLVVTDRMMPPMNGDTLTARIHEISPQTPVIMCSGALPEPPSDALFAAFRKPVDPEALAQAARSALVLDRGGKTGED